MPAKTTTWTAAADLDFTNAGNWDNGVAVDGDTINSSTNTTPTANFPVAGTFHFNVTNAVSLMLSNFLNGAAIGNVVVNSAGASPYCAEAITGTVTVTAGGLTVSGITTITGLVSVAASANFSIEDSGGPYTVTANGGFQLAGTLNLGGGVLDLDGAVGAAGILLVTANGAAVDWAGGDIIGGFNANGKSVTHTTTGGETITCNVAGTFDLGTTTANAIAVTNTADVTTANTWTCGVFTCNAALTVGANFSCTQFVKTSGLITGGGKIITITGAGGLTGAGCTLDSQGSLTFSLAASGPITWASSTACPNLAIATGQTATTGAPCFWNQISGLGSLEVATGHEFNIKPSANNFWTLSGTVTYAGTGSIRMYFDADRSNAAAINLGATPCRFYNVTASRVITSDGNFTCGTLNMYSANTQGQYSRLVMGPGANLSCTTLVLGAAASNRSGQVVLGSGAHAITGAISALGTGNANAFTAAGKISAGGNWTLSGIATDFGSAVVVTSAAVTIDGASATSVANTSADILGNGAGKAITVTNVNNASTPALRVWNANVAASTGNTNVQVCPGPPELVGG